MAKKYNSIDDDDSLTISRGVSELRQLRNKSQQNIFQVRETLRTRYKILYIALVFVGLSLCWYGVWQGVQSIPILNNPIVACIVGLILLSLTGRVNELE